MPRERQLSELLSEFALTMVTDFAIQGILERLVGRIVEILPVTGAGVTLISPVTDPHYVAASDAAAQKFLQPEPACWMHRTPTLRESAIRPIRSSAVL